MFKQVLLLLFALFFSYNLLAQAQPIFGNQPKKKEQTHSWKDYRKLVHSEITSAIRSVKKEGDFGAVLLMFGFAFIYGVLHSLGPGHGKFLVSSYLMGHPTKIPKAFLYGVSIGVIHVLSGVIVSILLLFLIEQSVGSNSDIVFNWASRLSYISIIIIGVFLFIKSVRGEEHVSGYETFWSIALVPCPASIILLTFAYSVDLFPVGLLGTIGLALGIGLTVGMFGVLGVSVNRGVLKLVRKSDEIGDKMHNVLSLVGNGLLILLGTLFLYLYW